MKFSGITSPTATFAGTLGQAVDTLGGINGGGVMPPPPPPQSTGTVAVALLLTEQLPVDVKAVKVTAVLPEGKPALVGLLQVAVMGALFWFPAMLPAEK
jgi:hypothetical protein